MKKVLEILLQKLWLYFKNFIRWVAEEGDDLMNKGFLELSGKDHSLNAKFAPESTLLQTRFTGFNLTGKGLTPSLSQTNILVTGNSGSGKTSVCLIKSVLSVEGSQTIHDPSFEIYSKCSGALAQKGYRIVQLDLTNPKRSHFYNPMHRAKTPSQLNLLATQLMSNSMEKGKKDFWSNSAVNLLVCGMEILRLLPLQYQNLYNLAYLLTQWQSESGRENLDILVATLCEDNSKLFEKYLAINSTSANTLSGIISSAEAATKTFLLDECIAETTSRDTIGDFMNIRKEKTAIFLHSSIAKAEYLANISSMFLTQFFESFFERIPEPEELDCYFHLEELPVLSINNLDLIISNIRKYRGAILGVTQDAENQLTTKYGREKATAIINNMRVKLYLSASLDIATKLSKEFGTYEYKDKKSGQTKRRELMTADEIMSLPSEKALITVVNQRPILAKLKPYYKDPKLLKMKEIPTPLINYGTNDEEDTTPQLLNISEYLKSIQNPIQNPITDEQD